jgi:hypothetical protein
LVNTISKPTISTKQCNASPVSTRLSLVSDSVSTNKLNKAFKVLVLAELKAMTVISYACNPGHVYRVSHLASFHSQPKHNRIIVRCSQIGFSFILI